MARRVFITVAEVSGDKHAAQLIRSLKQLDPTIIIEGLGGPEMAAAGATIHRNTVTKATMGWRGIFRASEVIDALKWTRNYFNTYQPHLQIGVDSPSMNFHFAKAAHGMNIPVLQYVAPQLWAWATWRMKKLRKWVDQVACILPFEEAYFRSHGVKATFVGHPLFDELPPNRSMRNEATFPAKPPVIGLLAGSRRSEAEANFSGLLDAGEQIRREFPETVLLVPTTPATHPIVEREIVRRGTTHITAEIDKFDQMVPRCDLCLTVSGTATLHVAALGAPMLVVYRVSRLAWNLAGRWLVPTRTFALVNLLAATNPTDQTKASRADHLVPEFVPWHGSGEPLAQTALELLRHPQRLAEQRQELRRLIERLDHPGASDNTARVALEMIRTGSSAVDRVIEMPSSAEG
jgi:lipid-A-disaccharide synthase